MTAALVAPRAREGAATTPAAIARGASIVMLLGFLAVRPNIFGESFANTGLILCAVVLAFVIAKDWGRARMSDASGIVVLAFVCGSGWDAFRAVDYGYNPGPYMTGFVTGLIVLVSFGYFMGDPARMRAFVRMLLWLVAALSAASAITFAMAATTGVIRIGEIPLGNLTASVLFPATPTLSHLSFFGIPLDRAIGIGREPGWWGMYAAFAWALWPAVMPRTFLSGVGRWVNVIGVITSASTAGFAIFAVALALDLIFRPRPRESSTRIQLRWLVGAAALATATWLAFNAPQLGLNAKATTNNVSLEGRNLVTSEGLHALLNLSLGEPSVNYAPNVNLIAGASVGGWPFFVLGLCALLMPLAFTRHRLYAMTPITVLTLTILFAQPISGSHAVYVLVMIACAVAEHSDRKPTAPEMEAA